MLTLEKPHEDLRSRGVLGDRWIDWQWFKLQNIQRKEAPMKRGHFIGLDTHCQFAELAVVTHGGRTTKQARRAVTISALVEGVESIARPRYLVIEEGPLADWLWRNLRSQVDEMQVCDPRRNRLVCQEGDKDDPIDAEKLAQLYRGGYTKAVHHAESSYRSVFKQHVMLYHDRVRHRVAEGHRLVSLLRRHGVGGRERNFANPQERDGLLRGLPNSRTLRGGVSGVWKGYDVGVLPEGGVCRGLVELAKEEEVLQRMVTLPGIGWVRAATLWVWLDTPWRFAKKQALWKYLGIGLERRRSGNGPEKVRVPVHVNRVLKSTILGAAKSAAAQGKNPFADQYRRWLAAGLSPQIARRDGGRLVAVTWGGMGEKGRGFPPEWVGVGGGGVHGGKGFTAAAGCALV